MEMIPNNSHQLLIFGTSLLKNWKINDFLYYSLQMSQLKYFRLSADEINNISTEENDSVRFLNTRDTRDEGKIYSRYLANKMSSILNNESEFHVVTKINGKRKMKKISFGCNHVEGKSTTSIVSFNSEDHKLDSSLDFKWEILCETCQKDNSSTPVDENGASSEYLANGTDDSNVHDQIARCMINSMDHIKNMFMYSSLPVDDVMAQLERLRHYCEDSLKSMNCELILQTMNALTDLSDVNLVQPFSNSP